MTRQYFENLIMIHDDIWITDGTNTYWLKWGIKGLPGEDKIHISLQHTWGEKPNPVFCLWQRLRVAEQLQDRRDSHRRTDQALPG